MVKVSARTGACERIYGRMKFRRSGRFVGGDGSGVGDVSMWCVPIQCVCVCECVCVLCVDCDQTCVHLLYITHNG